MNFTIRTAIWFVTAAGAGVRAILGVETITAQTNAHQPRTEMPARAATGASRHSRCQSAISGSNVPCTVSRIEPP